MKKLTTEEFVKKAKKIHGDKYDYSLVDYVNAQTRIKIICPIHGEFEQTPNAHTSNKRGCSKCFFEKLSILQTCTTKSFIYKCIKIHGDKFDYSLTEYKGANKKVKIICKKHGVFVQSASSHLQGHGCKFCFYERESEERTIKTSEFINRAKKIHGDKFDYSLANYIGQYKKIKIICPIHGEFEQLPSVHINNKCGCRKCTFEKYSEIRAATTEEFIKKAIKIHGNKYNYSKVIYKHNKNKIKIICSKHGEFEQLPNNHLSGKGCPFCKTSKGENTIKKILENNNINFKPQNKFKNCKDIRLLPFDFYLLDYNICIEYDGEQHFKPIEKFDGQNGFKKIQIRDKIKTEYCKNNNILLLRISYKEDIEHTLLNYLKNYNVI